MEASAYALPNGELIVAVARTETGHLSASYYEELTDDDAANLAAEIIGHQFADRPPDQIMGSIVAFQEKLMLALQGTAAIDGDADELPEGVTDHGPSPERSEPIPAPQSSGEPSERSEPNEDSL